MELENRRTYERNLEEAQRSLENEKQAKTQIGATNREGIEKLTSLERQVNSFSWDFSIVFLSYLVQ